VLNSSKYESAKTFLSSSISISIKTFATAAPTGNVQNAPLSVEQNSEQAPSKPIST
jgi:hypothetical protein